MKQEFSKSWISSKQVRKQRKYRANAPLHILGKLLGGHLSKELRKKYGTRSITVRTDDEVKVMRGKFKGKTGKITKVDIKKQRVTIEGLQNKKKDGTKINAYFDTSNLLVMNIKEDKKRLKKVKKTTANVQTKKDTKVSEGKENTSKVNKPKETKEKKENA
tara:strand:+ start:98 stop:580 length:483 start_codon:yes stop_codon:yes gene_type:complete